MSANMFMKFENPAIDGSSKAPGHARETEVLSWNHGFVPFGRGDRQNFSFTKYFDAATDALLQFSFNGNQIGKATLRCYRSDGAGGDTILYLEIVMEHVVISNYSVSGGPGDNPVENVVLDYGTVQYHYTPTHE